MGEDEENDEPDHETFVSQAMHELRCGSADIALEYLNSALKLEQDDENIFIMRLVSRTLTNIVTSDILELSVMSSLVDLHKQYKMLESRSKQTSNYNVLPFFLINIFSQIKS